MEKNTYIAPTFKVRPMDQEEILAASGDPESVAATVTPDEATTGHAASKPARLDLWADDAE